LTDPQPYQAFAREHGSPPLTEILKLNEQCFPSSRSFERNEVPRRINIFCNFAQVSDEIVNLVLKFKEIFATLEVMRDTAFNLAKP
jgi:hypothetical protein